MTKAKRQMKSSSLQIDAQKETTKIVAFFKNVFQKTRKKNAVIGWSGGIDSTVSLHLLTKSIDSQNIFVYHLPYIKSYWKELVGLAENLKIPEKNIHEIAIKKGVDMIWNITNIKHQTLKQKEKIRLGNIMARVRMIVLFDQANLHDALVCGTENKSEHLLGYFTRFGDAASDIEPISYLYKTQVFQLAEYLHIDKKILNRKPSADLWEAQTDEGEFGFTYKEADEVLYRYTCLAGRQVDKSIQIKKEGFKNTNKIIERYKNNTFKHEVPYVLT